MTTEIALTGATGFLGSHLVARLRDEPGVELRLLSRRPAAAQPSSSVRTVQGDLREGETCHRLVTPGSIVLNLAYDAAGSRDDNLAMAKNLAAACRDVGARRLVHCSTAVVVGRAREDLVTEATTCLPVSDYERCKLDIERVLLEELRGSCPLTIVRPTAIFGLGGRNLVRIADELTHKGRLHAWAKAILLADRRLHLVCVENVVAALLFLLHHPQDLAGERFIVSDDEAPENNYREVATILARELALRRPPVVSLPLRSALLALLLRRWGRSDTNPRRIYSCHKLLDLGFEKPLPLVDGLRRFAAAYPGAAREAAQG